MLAFLSRLLVEQLSFSLSPSTLPSLSCRIQNSDYTQQWFTVSEAPVVRKFMSRPLKQATYRAFPAHKHWKLEDKFQFFNFLLQYFAFFLHFSALWHPKERRLEKGKSLHKPRLARSLSMLVNLASVLGGWSDRRPIGVVCQGIRSHQLHSINFRLAKLYELCR